MSEKIKPCPTPWCDDHSQPILLFDGVWHKAYFVRCDACHLIGPYAKTEDAATAAWNRRTPDPRVSALVEAGKKYRDAMESFAGEVRRDTGAQYPWPAQDLALPAFEAAIAAFEADALKAREG